MNSTVYVSEYFNRLTAMYHHTTTCYKCKGCLVINAIVQKKR